MPKTKPERLILEDWNLFQQQKKKDTSERSISSLIEDINEVISPSIQALKEAMTEVRAEIEKEKNN